VPRILCIGECMLEFAMQPDGNFKLGFAGDTFNTAWYLRARLPTDWQVDYFTALGDDPYSVQMLDFMSANGIGTAHVKRITNRRPGLYVIRQEKGDRQFAYWRGQSAAKQLADDAGALATGLNGTALAYFSGITIAILDAKAREILLSQLSSAKTKGTRIAFDPNERPALWASPEEMRNSIEAAARIADFVFPTFSDEQLHFGDTTLRQTAARYLALSAGEVVVKNGGEPALIASAQVSLQLAPEPIAVPVDTTAAGDSFNSAYLAARLTGADPQHAAQAAHRVAKIVISHPGALVPMELGQ